MSRVGNIQGPSKDDVIAHIPLEKFRCTPEEVEQDTYIERFSTVQGEVDPVKIDEGGKPYCEFVGPDGLFRHCLDDSLRGDILVNVGAHFYVSFAVKGKHSTPREYVAVLSDGQCEVTPTPDGHLQLTEGKLPPGIGIAEQVALHQWRLKIVSPQAA
ncbi:MAG: hypothetical protein A3H73_01045 [Candidatus Taylorbacteria bacterium RIFCSPLOWO2_02_FULL_50_120]|nr:MAG: hypothetical protein A3H73_01045 [Candidatus Taylorbacteria bacterium RIFCSPLOWO2_02_FULL_50_120]